MWTIITPTYSDFVPWISTVTHASSQWGSSISSCLVLSKSFWTATKTPPPTLPLSLSHLCILYSLLNFPASPISPSAWSGLGHVSVAITMSGLQLSNMFWKDARLLTTDWQFTLKSLIDFLVVFLLCWLWGMGDDMSKGGPGDVKVSKENDEHVLDPCCELSVVSKSPTVSCKPSVVLNSVVPKFGTPQARQCHEQLDVSICSYMVLRRFWQVWWYHTSQLSQHTPFSAHVTGSLQ